MRVPFRYLILIAVLVLGIGGYVGFWLFLAGRVEPLVARWAEERRADGYRVAYGPVSVEGFPFRLLARIERPEIAGGGASEAPWEWRGERLSVVTQPWKLRHLIFSFDGEHRVGYLAGSEVRIVTARAEVPLMSVISDRAGRIERVAIDFQKLVLDDQRRETPWRIERLQLLGRADAHGRAGETAPAGELALHLEGVELPPGIEAPLGPTIARFVLRVLLIEPIPPEPLDQALARWREAGGTVELTEVALDWGPLKARGEGTLALDQLMRPIGAGTVVLEGHREAISALRAGGVIGGGEALAARVVLSAIAKKSEGGKALHIPISAQDGVFHLGPLPLLSLPSLVPPSKK